MAARLVARVFGGADEHVVGDGFPVQTFIPQPGLDREIDPFLLLDYAKPHEFGPTDRPRGVGEHPHRGFETVTVVYQGELEHRDSAGHAGALGPGDVQWMTAAAGIVHEERHARAFARRGGTIEMAQIWVNLPRLHKMSPPRYQDIRARDIPDVALEGGASARVIAGTLNGRQGPAMTFTPVDLYDVGLPGGGAVTLPLHADHNVALVLLRGEVRVAGTPVRARELALLAGGGDRVTLETPSAAALLVLSGRPLDEPVERYGPFVMTTREELAQAFDDYRHGRMGHLAG
jgi:redox-sensitive bicupin YhaK (pirin superfamily)